MRKHLIGASATLVLALSACGGSPAATASPPTTCINASAPRHAYVVVEHLSGTAIQACVGFSTDAIDGQTLMDKSGIKYAFQKFSFGSAVCQIDNEPTQYSQCFPQGKPYWALFIETGGKWAPAQNGYTDAVLHDKDALGWHYVDAADPSPAPPPAAKE